MAKSKAQLARELYHGASLSSLTSGEKANVTKKFKAQSSARPTRRAGRNTFQCHVGRANINGTESCLVSKGTTVAELIDQAEYSIDEDKEAVTKLSTGEQVDPDDEVENNETYVISQEIESA